MEIEKRSISQITPNAENVRRHGKTQIEEFKKSIQKFDVIRPIVIDENGVILAGHGLYEALTELGYETVDVIVKKGLSEKDKKKLLLADNKVYSLGHDDFDTIEKILSELGQENDFEVPGYDADTLEALYGIQSLEKDEHVKETLESAIPQSIGSQDDTKAKADEHPAPKASVAEARAEAERERRTIICPKCGEAICL